MLTGTKHGYPMTFNIDTHSCQGRVDQPNAYSTLKPLAPLNRWVKEFWQLNVPIGQYFYRSVPDNCVDMIVNLTYHEEAFIVTPFSTAKVFEMLGPVSYFGIRFHTLGYQGLITSPLNGWNNADNVINMNEIAPKHVLSAFDTITSKVMSFKSRCEYFSKELLSILRPYDVDARLMRYIFYCYHSINSTIDLSQRQCSEFGLSARQLRRLTAQYLGLSPKEFAKIVRFQNALQAINTGEPHSLWGHAYYDQPHFNRDFKSMSGVTPSVFKNMSVLYNTD